MAADAVESTPSPKCVLDDEGCVTLRDILISFNAPINEEHAWALYYLCAKCIASAAQGERKTKCLLVSKCEHIHMHKDGFVHENTVFAGGGDSEPRAPMPTAQEVVVSLGLAVFAALDFGFDVEEERALSDDLVALIRHMTVTIDSPRPGGEMDDEGIERDAGDTDEDPSLLATLLDSVVQLCVAHVGSGTGCAAAQAAEQHYRAVCKALVFEALELASFLRKISARGTAAPGERRPGVDSVDLQTAHALDQLQISEWSRLWLQVIQELRHGVTLKKVDLSKARIEFTLTPYEIMMDDIRSRRYKLNKVMVDGDLPHRVKKDAHAVILDFIRSRPPLRKASQRQLAPARPPPATQHERLMNSIKIGRRLRPSLSTAPTPHHSPMKKRLIPLPDLSALSTLRDDSAPGGDAGNSSRRLIKVDYSMFEDEDDVDDEDDELEVEQPEAPPSNPWSRTAYDLATLCSASTPRGPTRASLRGRRRHTIIGPSSIDVPAEVTPHDVGVDRLGVPGTEEELAWSRSSLQDEFLHSANWQQAMDCLSLTLEEIVHIRSVLTKAELDGLPVEGHVKLDVEKRKVCFLCLKTRFGMFGPWGQVCKLCQRTVCVKCYSKMRIPTEHFSRIPVFALSPCLSPEDEPSFPRSFLQRISAGTQAGSLPPSPPGVRPLPTRMTSSLVGSLEGPRSLPTLSPSDKRSRLSRSSTAFRGTGGKESLRGLQMTVCHDCKTMVIQIILNSRASRSHAIRNLSLNLSPIY